MGVVIKASGISEQSHASSIDNAVLAARHCMEQAAIDPADIDLLINVGIYRDDNIMEPSIAALIQQRLGLNPDPIKSGFDSRTFSFDLMNGACGFLNAVDVAGAMLETGVYRNVLVVGGDVHPSRQDMPGFPFSSRGGAVLLRFSTDPQAGFGRVQSESTTRQDYFGYRSHGALQDFGDSGRQHGLVLLQPDFQTRFCQRLAQSVGRMLELQAVAPKQIDVLVTSQLESGFPRSLAVAVGLHADAHVVDLYDDMGDPHTAAPMLCLHALQQRGLLVPGQTILFALVGSGIATTCALYRVPA